MAKVTGSPLPDLVVADLSILDQVRQMAEDITSQYTQLNVLINNAGTFEKERRLTSDRVEMTFAVNYLAPFLLTRSLLPVLMNNIPSRVVTVASSAHEDVDHIDWDNLPDRIVMTDGARMPFRNLQILPLPTPSPAQLRGPELP